MTIISCGVEISIAGGGEEMVRVLSLGWFFELFLSFYCNHAFIVLGTKSLMQRELYENKNLQIQISNRLLHLLMGKNQIPGNHRKSPPRLAPKILIPQTRKEIIHRNEEERDPKPFSRVP